MIHPRVALASGAAAAAVGVLLLTGLLGGSIVLALVLALVARAAPLAGAEEPPVASRALGRVVALVPAWVLIVAVGAVRAGSVELADVRGANAIAGLAVARGDALVVVAAWLALAAGVLALLSPAGGARTYGGAAVAPAPLARMELVGFGLQAALLVTLFAGPSIGGIRDVGPWVVGTVAAVEAVWFGRRLAASEALARSATGLAALALALALLGGRV